LIVPILIRRQWRLAPLKYFELSLVNFEPSLALGSVYKGL